MHALAFSILAHASPKTAPHTDGATAPHSTKVLTLTEAVLLAIRYNPAVRNTRLQRIVDQYALAIAHHAFEPNFEFNSAIDYTRNEKPSYTLGPSTSIKNRFGTELSAHYNHNLTHDREKRFSVSITQPLLRGIRPSIVLAPLHNAIDQEAINHLSLKAQIMRTITETIASYYRLVQSHHTLRVRELALKESLNVLEEYKIKFKTGSIPRISVTEQQSQVASLQLDVESARNSVSRARHALLITLGLDPHANITVANTLIDFDHPSFDLKRSIHKALAHNIAYQQSVIAMRSRYREVAVQKDQQLWDLKLAGQIETIKQLQSARQTTSSAKLELAIPINDVNRRAGLVNAQIALKQAKINLQQARDRLIANVADAINDLNSQAKQLKLSQQKVILAEKTYKAALLSHQHGLNSASEVVRQQNTFINARLSLISLQINDINIQANFSELLGETLNDWHIELK